MWNRAQFAPRKPHLRMPASLIGMDGAPRAMASITATTLDPTHPHTPNHDLHKRWKQRGARHAPKRHRSVGPHSLAIQRGTARLPSCHDPWKVSIAARTTWGDTGDRADDWRVYDARGGRCAAGHRRNTRCGPPSMCIDLYPGRPGIVGIVVVTPNVLVAQLGAHDVLVVDHRVLTQAAPVRLRRLPLLVCVGDGGSFLP